MIVSETRPLKNREIESLLGPWNLPTVSIAVIFTVKIIVMMKSCLKEPASRLHMKNSTKDLIKKPNVVCFTIDISLESCYRSLFSCRRLK